MWKYMCARERDRELFHYYVCVCVCFCLFDSLISIEFKIK